MARELDGLGFWLPSEFLTDDDLLTDFESDRRILAKSFGFNSDLSSPGESEEDDLVSELTQKLAHSTLRNSDFSSSYTSKGWKLSSSPQSTLCGCKHCSTGSPNSVSGVCSPPDAEDYLRRDHLYAAAEEMARMRIIEQTAAFYSSKLSAPHAKLFPIPAAGVYPSQARSQSCISSQLLQAAKRSQQQQQLQMMKKGVYGPRSRVTEFQLFNGRRKCGDKRAEGLSMAAWPGLQQPGSRTLAFFPSEPGPKIKRTGTGVFLPKRFTSVPADGRKRAEKVGHALNVDVESIDNQLLHSMDYGNSNFDYDAALKRRDNVAEKRRNEWAMSQGWTC